VDGEESQLGLGGYGGISGSPRHRVVLGYFRRLCAENFNLNRSAA